MELERQLRGPPLGRPEQVRAGCLAYRFPRLQPLGKIAQPFDGAVLRHHCYFSGDVAGALSGPINPCQRLVCGS